MKARNNETMTWTSRRGTRLGGFRLKVETSDRRMELIPTEPVMTFDSTSRDKTATVTRESTAMEVNERQLMIG